MSGTWSYRVGSKFAPRHGENCGPNYTAGIEGYDGPVPLRGITRLDRECAAHDWHYGWCDKNGPSSDCYHTADQRFAKKISRRSSDGSTQSWVGRSAASWFRGNRPSRVVELPEPFSEQLLLADRPWAEMGKKKGGKKNVAKIVKKEVKHIIAKRPAMRAPQRSARGGFKFPGAKKGSGAHQFLRPGGRYHQNVMGGGGVFTQYSGDMTTGLSQRPSTITKSELIADVVGTAAFTPSEAFNIGPLEFPWLNGIAAKFDQWRIKNMRFRMVNVQPNAGGYVGICFDFDQLDVAPTTDEQVAQMVGKRANLITPGDPRLGESGQWSWDFRGERVHQKFFVEPHPSVGVPVTVVGGDPRLAFPAKLYVYSSGQSEDALSKIKNSYDATAKPRHRLYHDGYKDKPTLVDVTVAQLFVDYEIEFYRPQFETEAGALPAGAYVRAERGLLPESGSSFPLTFDPDGWFLIGAGFDWTQQVGPPVAQTIIGTYPAAEGYCGRVYTFEQIEEFLGGVAPGDVSFCISLQTNFHCITPADRTMAGKCIAVTPTGNPGTDDYTQWGPVTMIENTAYSGADFWIGSQAVVTTTNAIKTSYPSSSGIMLGYGWDASFGTSPEWAVNFCEYAVYAFQAPVPRPPALDVGALLRRLEKLEARDEFERLSDRSFKTPAKSGVVTPNQRR
jgi:hypothetical protein